MGDATPTPKPRSAAASPPTAVVDVEVDGVVYPLPCGESLQALADAPGLDISFGCFSGRCGMCRVEVVAGEEHLGERNDLEHGLLVDGDDDGRRLACQCRPTGPVKLKSTPLR